jgi:succinate dehydrogenase / fumarate reductase, cytochrome b subunit
MALTGVLLIGFVIAHLLGNLQVFLGADAFNAYAAFLKSIPGPLWVARIGLLFVFVLHIITAFQLRSQNKSARPVPYKKMGTRIADPASLYMIETGVVILLFVIIHLLHFTFGMLQPEYFSIEDSQGRHDVYRMLVLGFQNGPYAVTYILAMLALGYHLSHAFWSMFQTIGANSPRLNPVLRAASKGLAIAITLGYIAIPASVLVGIIS